MSQPNNVCIACNGERFVDRPIAGGWYEEKFTRVPCLDCCGTGLAPIGDDELADSCDSPEPDAVCACGASPVVAVVDGFNRCATCISDVSASFARTDDSGVDLLAVMNRGRRQSRASL